MFSCNLFLLRNALNMTNKIRKVVRKMFKLLVFAHNILITRFFLKEFHILVQLDLLILEWLSHPHFAWASRQFLASLPGTIHQTAHHCCNVEVIRLQIVFFLLLNHSCPVVIPIVVSHEWDKCCDSISKFRILISERFNGTFWSMYGLT